MCVINDHLGHTHSSASSDHFNWNWVVLKSQDGHENSYHNRPWLCGGPRGSIQTFLIQLNGYLFSFCILSANLTAFQTELWSSRTRSSKVRRKARSNDGPGEEFERRISYGAAQIVLASVDAFVQNVRPFGRLHSDWRQLFNYSRSDSACFRSKSWKSQSVLYGKSSKYRWFYRQRIDRSTCVTKWKLSNKQNFNCCRFEI